MGKALYRKYRSKSLAEIIGQEHITQTLGNALKKGHISHAYLFTGPRGTGKTSIARILAHEVNGLLYSEQAHLDIIEIDAASNRRIDEIRELKERVYTAPTSVKYKVYIIDEVHMLTREAFNALLKTLEEPPDHAIFILATTEAHKVPETIISRTQRFTFKPITSEKVVAHLKEIAKKENVDISDEALNLIAAHGQGSFRDSISLLDQMSHTNVHIALQDIQRAIGQAPDELLLQLLASLGTGNLATTAGYWAQLQAQGIQAPQVAHQLSELLRKDILQVEPQLPPEQSMQLLNNLVGVSGAQDSGLQLELALYSATLQNANHTVSSTIISEAASPPPEPVEIVTISAKSEPPPKTHKLNPPKPKTSIKNENPPEPVGTPKALDAKSWPLVLNAVKAKHNTLYGIARMAVPSFESGKLVLRFSFAFHQKRLDESKNKQMLSGIIKEITGQNMSVVCILDTSKHVEPSPEVLASEASDQSVDLQAISNIFGSAEVVE